MFLQKVELVAHASQGLGHVLLVPPARRIWAQVDTKSNGRSPLLVPVLSRTTIVSQDHLCIIWVKRMYASKVPFPRSSRHDQFQDLSPRHKKKGRKCTWHRIKGSGTTVSHQWSMNIQGTWSIFAWIVSWRDWRFTQMMIHHHTPLTSNHASFNIRKSRRSRMHLWCLFPFCSLPWLPFTAPSCVLSLLSTAQKRSKREAHSRRPCCGNVQPCMTDVMMITMCMSHRCYAKAQELRITKQKSPMEQKLWNELKWGWNTFCHVKSSQPSHHTFSWQPVCGNLLPRFCQPYMENLGPETQEWHGLKTWASCHLAMGFPWNFYAVHYGLNLGY